MINLILYFPKDPQVYHLESQLVNDRRGENLLRISGAHVK